MRVFFSCFTAPAVASFRATDLNASSCCISTCRYSTSSRVQVVEVSTLFSAEQNSRVVDASPDAMASRCLAVPSPSKWILCASACAFTTSIIFKLSALSWDAILFMFCT